AVLCHLLCAQLCDAYYAGGYLGYAIATFLSHYFTSAQIYVCAIAISIISVIIMFNADIKQIARYLLYAVRSCCSYATCMRVYSCTCGIIWLLTLPLIWFYEAAKKCVQGEDD